MAEVAIPRFSDLTGEAAARSLIGEALRTGAEGARAFLRGRHLLELREADIGELVKTRNLGVEIARQNHLGAQAAQAVSEAAFDPVTTFSLQHTRFEAFKRAEDIARFRDRNVDFDQLQLEFLKLNLANQGQGEPPVDAQFVCVIVDGQLVNGNSCANNVVFNKEMEFASFPFKPQFSHIGALGLNKAFLWGGAFNFGVQSKRRKSDFHTFPDFLEFAFANDDPIGLGSRMPWTSTISVGASSPVPYARNFGEYGSSGAINIKLADIGTRQADSVIAATSNQAEGQLRVLYWRLVGALAQVQVTLAQRETIADIVASTRRQYEKQLITAYDMAQAETQLENVRNQEEIAWSSYIQASDAINELLDYEVDTVMLPADYETAFSQEHSVDAGSARQTALANRQELKISQAGIDSSEVLVKFRENQMRPEFSIVASAFASQSDVAYGYEEWEDSILQVFNPDNTDYFVGIKFRLPFGKQAEKSALSQARITLTQAGDVHAQTELTITQEVNTSLASFLSARSQRDLARQQMDLAELAYQKIQRLKALGLASQFELLQTLNDILTARSAYIGAAVAYHQAHATVKTAEGLYQ